jgi:serine/threonine protein kinase
MSLSSGTKLGPYEVQSPLGAGGMGEVYRARDSRLNRDVAIKVLPAVFANDSERMARFQREAQLLASLNHPNIASIYGLEEKDGVQSELKIASMPPLRSRKSAKDSRADAAFFACASAYSGRCLL